MFTTSGGGDGVAWNAMAQLKYYTEAY